MGLTLLGIILFLLPFLLVFHFKNRLLGFLYILAFDIALHITIGIILQFFHVFSYETVFALHALLGAGVIAMTLKKLKNISFKMRINRLAVFAFLIVVFELWSAHFLYTGAVSTIGGVGEVEKFSYPYPYFSDEWVGISYSEYSIEHNTLPLGNPLLPEGGGITHPNIFVFFFSGISEFFLFLGISPLYGWVYLSIAISALICLLFYLMLRAYGTGNIPSAVAMLFLPYITNASNLPGLWYLLPFLGGVIFLLISIITLGFEKRGFSRVSNLFSILIYPPIVVFSVPVFFFDIFSEKGDKRKKIKYILCGFFLLFAGGVLIAFLQKYSFGSFVEKIVSFVFRRNGDNGIPMYGVWNIVPLLLLPFSLFGIWEVIRRKIYVPVLLIFVGLMFWLIYSRTFYFFIIDYGRVAVITSFFLVVVSAFGFDWILGKLEKKFSVLEKKNTKILLMTVLILGFGISSLFYTEQNDEWQKLSLRPAGTPEYVKVLPGAPANRYATEEDMKLFSGISGKIFLSPPWKGLVIGAGTGNYPLLSKTSIITNELFEYPKFMSANCEWKDLFAEGLGLRYVYSGKFDCEHFRFLGSSTENLYLYEFVR